ncbi:MAG: TRAP transporter permease [Bacillaceae bacterium]|nr:TRAP transporter permease [Bacillaceae bacterium]
MYQLYTGLFGTLPSQQQRGFHLALGLGLIFLLYPGKSEKQKPWVSPVYTLLLLAGDFYLYYKEEISLVVAASLAVVILLFQLAKTFFHRPNSIPVFDLLLGLVGIGVGMYQFFFYEDIISRVGMYNDMDYIVAGTAVLMVLEAARRIVGLPIVVVASAALIYAWAGPSMPGFLNHRGFSVERVISHSYLSTEGILGIPIAISATYIFLYLFFGVLLQKTAVAQFFNDLALALTGRAVGGPAKAAVVASAFQGTITGSSVANTVGSGSFTIPMMKRNGYKGEFAAAVEASASTGGQLMPPIMGAAAFLMIEFTGIEYSTIALAAAIPALLYFSGVFIAVHLESKREGIIGLPKEQLPQLKELMLKRGYLLLPLVAIITILVMGQSPIRAALWGIGVAYVVGFLNKETRMGFRETLQLLEDGAKVALQVIAACAAAGIIVGVITLTGLGLKVAGGIIDIANQDLFLTMLFTMVASIILGMGLPTTANYVITATMAAPALLELGVPVIAAHMFVFYFGIVADITPPVALAAYAGSGIARSNPMQTAITAFKIAIAAFLIPYMFVYGPELVLAGDNVNTISIILAVITALVGMVGVSGSMLGYFVRESNWIERIIMIAGGLTLLAPGINTDIIGLALLGLVYIWQKFYRRTGSANA